MHICTQNIYTSTVSPEREHLYHDIDQKRAQEQVPYVAPVRQIGDVVADKDFTPEPVDTTPCPMHCNGGYLNSAGDENTLGRQRIPCWHCNPRGDKR